MTLQLMGKVGETFALTPADGSLKVFLKNTATVGCLSILFLASVVESIVRLIILKIVQLKYTKEEDLIPFKKKAADAFMGRGASLLHIQMIFKPSLDLFFREVELKTKINHLFSLPNQ